MKPRKLVWTEGLFVTQHHFQQLDRYHEALLADRLRAALSYDWGITEIEIDERALGAGQLKVSKLAAILPDGSVTSCGDGLDDAIPPRPIEGMFTPQMRTMDVYVGVAHEGENAPNVELEGKPGALTRYIREQASVFDFNSGMGEQAVQWSKKNLKVLFQTEPRESFDSIRVAQLARAPNGAVMLKESFIPSVLRVGASKFLMTSWKRLLAALTARQRELSESRRQRTAAAVEFVASDAANFWLLNALNLTIPVASHIVDQQNVHPEAAYLALAQLIGQLCTLAVDGDPTTIPKFNYLELGDVFEPMFARAHKLLETVIPKNYVQIQLQKREDGMYLGKIDNPALLRFEFFLAAQGSLPEGQIRDRLPKLSKIASWNHIAGILGAATNGAKLELEYRPPGALPVKPGVIFFKVIRTPEFWADIAGTGTIAIYQPMEPAAMNLSLYAVDPQNLQ